MLRGLAASRGVYEGPARVIAGPSEFDRIEKGDVLVTVSTTEAFNILLPLLGAIVTDSGGLLSHSAIVAREYGIPGVVGTREATERIADGARVRVDGDAGEVTVLGMTRRRLARGGGRDLGLRLEGGRVGAGASGTAFPSRPVSRSPARSSTRCAGGDESAIEEVATRGATARRPPGRSFVGGRRGRRGRELRGAAPDAAQRPVRPTSCRAALSEIWWSANSDSAITYRQRVGLYTRPSIGVVVQALLDPETAGVMFTQNPVTGADERVIEASWGLGEAVVAGQVIPDHYRISRTGEVLERTPGLKKLAIRTVAGGGTREEEVSAGTAEQLCLDDDDVGS